jgi:hypothetical protein
MIPLYAKMERIVKAATKKRYAVEKLSDWYKIWKFYYRYC